MKHEGVVWRRPFLNQPVAATNSDGAMDCRVCLKLWLPGPNGVGRFHRSHKDLPVTWMAGKSRLLDGAEYGIHLIVLKHNQHDGLEQLVVKLTAYLNAYKLRTHSVEGRIFARQVLSR